MDTWCKFTRWGSSLSGDINIDINSNRLDLNADFTINCEEQVFVMEVTIGSGGCLGNVEVDTVVSVVEFDIDIVNIRLWDLDDKVLKISSIEVNLWD